LDAFLAGLKAGAQAAYLVIGRDNGRLSADIDNLWLDAKAEERALLWRLPPDPARFEFESKAVRRPDSCLMKSYLASADGCPRDMAVEGQSSYVHVRLMCNFCDSFYGEMVVLELIEEVYRACALIGGEKSTAWIKPVTDSNTCQARVAETVAEEHTTTSQVLAAILS
jgi:hypothetical protein